MTIVSDVHALLEKLGVARDAYTGGDLIVRTPITGEEIARVATISADAVDGVIARAADAFVAWRKVPGPRRGELVRILGNVLRDNKEALGRLV